MRRLTVLSALVLLTALVALPSTYWNVAKAFLSGTDEEAIVRGIGDTAGTGDYEAAFSTVLADVLTEHGLVHYDRLAVHPLWPDVVSGIERFPFRVDATDAEKLAFWLNAYNVHMLNMVAARPGRDNVLGLDVGASFFKVPVKVAGQQLSLDQIEHAILREEEAAFSRLRPERFDPRIHVALNCAAVSCPRLWPDAFSASELDAQLDRNMRAFVDSPQHFRIEDGRFVVSSLLDWFGKDFDRAGMPAGDWLLSHMSPERAQYAEIAERLRGRTASDIDARYSYDWTVNRAR